MSPGKGAVAEYLPGAKYENLKDKKKQNELVGGVGREMT